MLKLVFIRPETQADATLRVLECCSQHGSNSLAGNVSGANLAGRHRLILSFKLYTHDKLYSHLYTVV